MNKTVGLGEISMKSDQDLSAEMYLYSLWLYQQGRLDEALAINPHGLGGDGDRNEDDDVD